MQNFVFHNPVKIIFGRGTIASLEELVPARARVMLLYGSGSIKGNGVYDQVMAALRHHRVEEFGGIEPNPSYETCMRAVARARSTAIDFLLAAGGGSVMDATKFIAAAIPHTQGDPWDMVLKKVPVSAALPLGCVVTMPATGSEMNLNAVISRTETQEKIPLKSEHLYPRFSILDPDTTFSLPYRQLANGVVDTFAHVCEQYLTYPANAPLQDRQAEAILLTLLEEAPKLHSEGDGYAVRANLMWCATQALNHSLSCGVPGDWSSHAIGHDLTARFGLEHARSLAIVLPAVLSHQRHRKAEKLLQFARRVWGVTETTTDQTIDAALARTRNFFETLGLPTRLRDYQISPADCRIIEQRLGAREPLLGEHQDLGAADVAAILALAE